MTPALSGMTARLFWGLAVGLALVGCESHPLNGGGVHGMEPGPEGPPGSGIASDALSGVRSVKKCLVPKRQGGTPRLRLARRDGADAPLQCLPLVGCDMPGNA